MTMTSGREKMKNETNFYPMMQSKRTSTPAAMSNPLTSPLDISSFPEAKQEHNLRMFWFLENITFGVSRVG
jgi:hypothetical protein